MESLIKNSFAVGVKIRSEFLMSISSFNILIFVELGSGLFDLADPGLNIGFNKIVIVELRVVSIHPVNLFCLAGRKRFIRVKTPDPFQDALSFQYLMNASNASSESILGIKKG